MNLRQAFGLEQVQSPPRIAFVGAGGKTTAVFQLARQLLDSPYSSVLITTTTHLSVDEVKQADHVYWVGKGETLPFTERQLPSGIILVCGEITPDQRVQSLTPDQLQDLHAEAEYQQIPLLIEADGSRRKPLKAPAEYEPVIPDFIREVVVVVGLLGIGKPLTEEMVHRAERFARLAGLAHQQEISPEAVAKYLNHPMGGMKGIPSHARRMILLNQADCLESLEIPHRLARMILRNYERVVIASLKDSPNVLALHRPIAGIVLAAGAARRFNKPKQLLEWKGRSFIHSVVHTALAAGLDPVWVVTGAYHDKIVAHLDELPVSERNRFHIVFNADWQNGQSTSLRAGLRQLSPDTEACVFLLADQPAVPVELIRRIQEVRAETQAWIVAPRYRGRRANPVLFGKELFTALAQLEGDKGGRALLQEPCPYPVAWVDWDEPGWAFDVDAPDDYQRLIEGQVE